MGTWSGRSWALALAVSMVAVGCGGGGSDEPAFPENTLQINGTRARTDPPTEVWYVGDIRSVDLYDVDGNSITLRFVGQGDPEVYELPLGHFTENSAALDAVTVCIAGPCRTYYAPDDVRGDVYVGGEEDPVVGTIQIAGAFALDDGAVPADVVFSYGGAYHWLAEP